MKLTKNYHTHLYRCQHAQGDVADYCQAAIDAGLTVLGISDHVPFPDNRWSDTRMPLAELPAYCHSIDEARQHFAPLTVLKALECEYDKSVHTFLQEELLGRFQLDYLIGAIHFIPYQGDWIGVYQNTSNAQTLKIYTQLVIDAIDSGLFAFIAHPDLFANAYLKWDTEAQACCRAILEAAAATQIPLEINGYGLRKPYIHTAEAGWRPMYPWQRFWALAAEYEIKIIVNSDAHRPEDVCANMEEAADIALAYQLKFADLSYLETC
ncbi:MAG: histidinol-phosphatase [Pseudomonadota bacterium]|nr:histidinol-phosphatase [Pseudomonadota bacterium]